jgi:hypothetical protein
MLEPRISVGGRTCLALVLALGLSVFSVACSTPTPTPTSAPTEVPPTATSTAMPTATAMPQPTVQVPNLQLWESSAHADASAPAFTHWDTDTPPEIPVSCAECHSAPGFRDFLGADGSEAGVVNSPAPTGTVITCEACHNAPAEDLTSVTFPSGITLTDVGPEAVCLECHQGREATDTVDKAISDAQATRPDTVSPDLSFTNVDIHNGVAAAIKYGGAVQGGYQYPGKYYDVNFVHVPGHDTCVQCHNPHSLQLDLSACSQCHGPINTTADLKNILKAQTPVDYDGDGNVEEGIYHEIEGIQQVLLTAIQKYAATTAGTDIAYDASTYPFWFIDTNGNGKADSDETAFSNAYNAWTPRLLKAAYNYQASVADPGQFAHNSKYVIQLLYDSSQDLDTNSVATLIRDNVGHFDGALEAWRHWDSDPAVPGTCSRCHSDTGLAFYLQQGANVSAPQANGLACSTCHDDLVTFSRYNDPQVEFPSGAALSFEITDANLCLDCHQGRNSTPGIDAVLEGLPDDTVSSSLSFIGPHYYAAGATLFGSEAAGAYQYAGRTYTGRFPHTTLYSNCIECHEGHLLNVDFHVCAGCHTEVDSMASLRSIRRNSPDYDGIGDAQEGVADDISTMHDELYVGIQAYAREIAGRPIVYSAANYPYFFNDLNDNGQPDADETVVPNAYSSWTPRLVRAAYNYQFIEKDPGSFAHNPQYCVQILYDSVEDLGQEVTVNMAGWIRP